MSPHPHLGTRAASQMLKAKRLETPSTCNVRYFDEQKYPCAFRALGRPTHPAIHLLLTFWSTYLFSSIASLFEWSHEAEEADGSLRSKQVASCCCRSINCFIKLSLVVVKKQKRERSWKENNRFNWVAILNKFAKEISATKHNGTDFRENMFRLAL